MASPFLRAANVAWTSPRYVHLRKLHHTRQKIPLPTLGRSYSEQKNQVAIGRNSERCSYYTDLSRFVLHISDPSALNFSQFVGFQNSPNLSKIEKVAKTCEFDGKEPLSVERTIAISIRVLGWICTYMNFTYTYIYMCIFACMYCMYVLCTLALSCFCVLSLLLPHAYINAHTYTYTHTYTHTRTLTHKCTLLST